MLLNCIIIDDEPIAVNGLVEYCNHLNSINLLGTAFNIEDAKDLIDNETIDLIFLDIQLPKITGVDFLKSQKINKLVVFTTAYPEYAIDGFDLNVFDYLLKPINFERFKKCIGDVCAYKEYLDYKNLNSISGFIYLRSPRRIQKLYLEEILFIEGCSNYIKIVTDSKQILHYTSLYKFHEMLDSNQFIRVHRSYIVNLKKIDLVEKGILNINSFKIPYTNGEKLP